MAKKRKKKSKRKKRIEDLKRRSATAMIALIRSGGGFHGDRRIKRLKTRKAQKEEALKE